MEDSAIEWTDHTFNPWWGCTKISPACDNCYADLFARRCGHGRRLPMIWGPGSERKEQSDRYWREPLRWNATAAGSGIRARVFCASMADVFEARPTLPWLDSARERLWNLIEQTQHLDWLLLTKRPQNMIRMTPQRWASGWPANVWAGVTCEDQPNLVERWRHLRQVPAVVRFISAEPLLGALDLSVCGAVDWIILGGESGPGARPLGSALEPLIGRARELGIAPFVKQLGSVWARANGHGAHHGTNPEVWPEGLRVREWPSPGLHPTPAPIFSRYSVIMGEDEL